MMNKTARTSKRKSTAQAMVEFALALPILLMVMYGLIESARLLFMYASVVSAARQAVRYGSVTGQSPAGVPYYNDCAGIQNAANRLAFLQTFSLIDIQYDSGPGTADIGTGCPITDPAHPASGDRIKVEVTSHFDPILPLLPFESFDIYSQGARTLLKSVSVVVDVPGVILTPGTGDLSISKDANPTSYDHLGQAITYIYTVRNLGTDTITGISVSDSRNVVPNPVNCPGTTLGPSASFQCTSTYTVIQADIDAGSIMNTGTVTGTSSTGPDFAQTSRTINFVPKPAITLAKDGTAPIVIASGQLITYVFTLTNSGNVALTKPYAISDALVTNWTCPSATIADKLLPGSSGQCTGSYALKSGDISKGSVTNTATATGMYGAYTVTSNAATAVVTLPPLWLDLTATPTSVNGLGTTITYKYTLTNRTLKTMSNLVVTDTRGANKYACLTSLAAGATNYCTRNYTGYTQADFDTGSIVNQASAAAGGSASSNTSTFAVTTNRIIKLTLTKTGSKTSAILGDVINYTYGLKNEGNVTLTGPFTVTDSKFPVSCSGAATTLAPSGGTTSCTPVSYTVKQTDMDAGSIVNKATAKGFLLTQPVTSAQVSWTVITFAGPRLGITKSANPTYFTSAGQVITYTYTLVNTGGVALSAPYSVTDNLIPSGVDCSVINTAASPLPIGGSLTCTATYPISSGDNLLGSVTNTATATAMNGAVVLSSTLPSPAVVTVPKFVCTSSTLKHAPPTPIASGSPVIWTIINNTGIALHINSITISWNAGPQLTQTTLGGAVIGAPSSSSGGYLVPGGPWLLATGNTDMQLTFTFAASGIRVVFTVSEPGCPSVDSNLVYPS